MVSIDNSVLVRVIEIDTDTVVVRVLCGGKIGKNKAVTVDRDISLPALTKKDRKALAIGREMGIRHVALSFAHCSSNVDEICEVSGEDAFVIWKIECSNALKRLDEIAWKSDALLVDRGDLFRQVPIEQIPNLQKNIIAYGREIRNKNLCSNKSEFIQIGR